MKRTKNNKKVRYTAIALPGIATSALAASHAAAEELSPLVINANSASEGGWFTSVYGEMVWLTEEELKKRELAQVITSETLSTVAEVTESGGFSEQLMKSLAWYSAGAGGLAGAALGALTSPAILQGPTGETGPQGPAGETGPQGPSGPAGADGSGLKYNNAHVAMADTTVFFYDDMPSKVSTTVFDADGIDLSDFLYDINNSASYYFQSGFSVSHTVDSGDLISSTSDDYLRIIVEIEGFPSNNFDLGLNLVRGFHTDGLGNSETYFFPVLAKLESNINAGDFFGAGMSLIEESGLPLDFTDLVLTYGDYAAYGGPSELTIILSDTGGETVIFGDGAALNGGQITIDLGVDTFEDKIVFQGRAENIIVQNYDLSHDSKIDVPNPSWSGVDDGTDIVFTQSANQQIIFEGLGGVGASLDPSDYFNEIYH